MASIEVKLTYHDKGINPWEAEVEGEKFYFPAWEDLAADLWFRLTIDTFEIDDELDLSDLED